MKKTIKIKARLCITFAVFILNLTACANSQDVNPDIISKYIEERNYPKAISALRENTEYENAEDLMKQLRFIVEGSTLSCNYSYIAAINAKKGVDAILGDYGFASDTSKWKNMYSLSNDGLNFSAITEDGSFVTTADDSSDNENVTSSWDNIEKTVVSSYNNDYIGLKSDGTVEYRCDSMTKQEQAVMSQWTGVVDIEAGYYVYALTGEGTVLVSDLESDISSKISSWSDIIAISAALDTIAGLKQDGTVVIFSENQYGSNDVSEWSDIVAIDTCGYFTIGLKADGSLITTEYNDEGLDISKVAEFTNLYVPSVKVD